MNFVLVFVCCVFGVCLVIVVSLYGDFFGYVNFDEWFEFLGVMNGGDGEDI